MRLGLFGGTFDPIHIGHLILAEQCREACGLDQVWFVVAGEPPHKRGDRTAVAHRLEMARIAVAGHSAFAVSELETTRPGPHYSVETLESVRRERRNDDLFFPDQAADSPKSICRTGRDPGRDRPTGDDRRGEPARASREFNPAKLPSRSAPIRARSCPSRSHRSASPRPTCADE